MPWIRRALVGFGIVSLAALGGGWGFLRSSLPVTTGTLILAGLEGPVVVVRDDAGVPTIRANNAHDLYMALGFAHSQDRLFQMDLQRRLVQGRLAEVFGREALGSDRTVRTLGLYRHAVAGVGFTSPEFKSALDAYAEGVNAFLTSDQRLPIEFTFLGYQPARWQAADSLAIGKLFALQLSANYRQELLRARLAQELGADELNELFPGYPNDGPVTVRKLAELTHDLPIDDMLAALPEFVGPQRASNNWVVDGAHSATGKPLLANDPHLDYTAPLTWYLGRLEAPGVILAGGMIAGVPSVLLGHNNQIAWGYTSTNADVEDIFVEELDPRDGDRYLTPNGSMPFGTIEERIPVKGQAPELLTIRTTRHGPVISDLPGRASTFPGKVFALQASFLVDDDRSVEAQWRASLARDWPSWIDALGPFTAPVQNMTYADRDGNIGFFMPGRVPLRKSGNGVAPVPGWTGDYDWIGWVPFEKLPQAFNPPVGRIATANNKIVPDTYPYLITHDWDDQYRIERIEWGLAKTPKQSIESSTRIQGDVVSLSAKRLVPLMVRAESGDARAKVAIERLANWDCEMAGDRPEPLIYVAWLRSLNKRLFEPRLGPNFKGYWAMTPRATEGVLTRHQHWCGRAGCPAVLRASLADALDELSAKYGEDPNTWRWGRAHQARFAHRIFSRIGFLRRFFDRQVPSDGSADTVNAGAFHFTNTNNPYLNTHGPGLRAIYDLEDLDKSVFLTALGQSGHILSPHYADLLPRWRSFNWLRLPSDAHGETLSLKPKS